MKNLIPLILIFNLALVLSCGRGYQEVSGDKQKNYAAELLNKELYEEAAAEYTKYLAHTPLNDKKKANVNYIIANIYLENLKDYKKALALYIKIKNLYPDSPLVSEVNKKIVECLERLGRSLDAAQELSASTSLDGEAGKEQSRVIATVGSRKITRLDLEKSIDALPDYLRNKIKTREDRINYLRQFVARDLLYQAARRKGFHEKQEIVSRVFEIKKEMLIQQYVQEELKEKVSVDSADIRLYFQANRARYREEDEATIRHILVKDIKAAQAVAEKAKKGNFAALARSHSQDPKTKGKGGLIGPVKRSQGIMGIKETKGLFDAIAKTKPGGIAGPVRSERGYHVVKVDKVKQGRPYSLREAWYQVQNDLYQERQQETYMKLMQRMLQAEDVAIFDDLVR